MFIKCSAKITSLKYNCLLSLEVKKIIILSVELYADYFTNK